MPKKESFEGYQPTPEEIEKAEGMMTDEEREMSKEREASKEAEKILNEEDAFILDQAEQEIRTLLDEDSLLFCFFDVVKLPENIKRIVEKKYHLIEYEDKLGIPSKEIYQQFISIYPSGQEALNKFCEETENSYDFQAHVQVAEKTNPDKYTGVNEDVYVYGLAVGDEKQNVYDSDELIGDADRVDQEYFGSLIDPDLKLSDQERKKIADTALPVMNTANLVFHCTPIVRVPLICAWGLLPPYVWDRYIKQRYGKVASQTSGWGTPNWGNNLIDVWDPTSIDSRVSTPATHIRGGMKRSSGKTTKGHHGEIPMIEKVKDYEPIAYETIPGDPIEMQGALNNRGGASFVIKLSEGREDKLIRADDRGDLRRYGDGKGNKWTYVRGRVLPEELAGLTLDKDWDLRNREIVIRLAEIFIANKKGGKPVWGDFWSSRDQRKYALSFKKAIDIIGNNIKMPIYNGSTGDLIWPEEIPYNEILERKLEEQSNLED